MLFFSVSCIVIQPQVCRSILERCVLSLTPSELSHVHPDVAYAYAAVMCPPELCDASGQMQDRSTSLLWKECRDVLLSHLATIITATFDRLHSTSSSGTHEADVGPKRHASAVRGSEGAGVAIHDTKAPIRTTHLAGSSTFFAVARMCSVSSNDTPVADVACVARELLDALSEATQSPNSAIAEWLVAMDASEFVESVSRVVVAAASHTGIEVGQVNSYFRQTQNLCSVLLCVHLTRTPCLGLGIDHPFPTIASAMCDSDDGQLRCSKVCMHVWLCDSLVDLSHVHGTLSR